jgi:WD40 repeat protein/DNA-binding SARP family transcriptional activator
LTDLSIRLFGNPSITLEDGSEADLSSAKARALLAYLAVECDQPQRRQKLVGLLWPGYTESSARANLRRALADLRQAIGERHAPVPRLLITPETIQFNQTSNAWVDVNAFARLLSGLSPATALDQSSPATRIEVFEEAARLYCASFLDGFSIPDSATFEEWMLITREHFHRLALQAFYQLAECYQEGGEYGRALAYAWRQLELDPWQESAHRQVMQLQALSGQRVAALAQYETCRRLLQTELGVEPSHQTRQLYELLRDEQWPAATSGEAGPPIRIARVTGECPYRGLAAFREQDAVFFYGREAFTDRLVEAVLHGSTPIVLVGPSGSGKSSVISAGLLPQLRQEVDWLTALFRPGAQPFHALAAALMLWLEPESSETERLIQANKLATALLCQEISLAIVLERLLAAQQPAGSLLLVIDQFEELYTLCSEAHTRQHFLAEILAAAGHNHENWGPRIRLLLVLRADFMGQALACRPFADTLQQGALLLGPMSMEELRLAIEKPAEIQGAAFEPGLVDRVLDDLGNEPGNLPLLEFALTLLWEGQAQGWLTHAAYESIGQVKGALACYAEQTYNQLDQAGQSAARQVFIQLVRPGEGTEDTRRLATRAEIGEQNWPLTERLADKRLVVTGHATGSMSETVELVHEALIQNWERLRGWIEDDRSFRTWQEELRAALHQWQSHNKDEDALLRGAPLAQAEIWYSERGTEIGSTEKEFIQASLQLRQHREMEREAQRQYERAAERRARRLLGGLVGVLALAVIIALALSTYSLRQGRQTLEAYSLSLAAHAQRALEDQDSSTGLALALAANRIPDPPRPVQRTLMDAAYAPGPRWREPVGALFPGASGPVTALEISPDGRIALSGLQDGSLIVWDMESKKEIQRLHGHTVRINDLAISPDGSTALSGGDDRQVILWDLETGDEIRRFADHSGSVRAVDFSPDARRAISGGFSGDNFLAPGELFLWDTLTGEEIRRFEGHVAGIVATKFTPDGRSILASSGDAEIFSSQLPQDQTSPGEVTFDLILWDASTGQALQRFPGYNDDAFSLAINPDGKLGLTGSFYNNVATLWNLETGEKLQTLEGHAEGIHAVAISPDGSRALTASYDDSLIYWDLANGAPLVRLKAHGSDVLSLGFSQDGRTALSSDRQGNLIRWDLFEAPEIQRLAGHGDMVYDVALTTDGKHALSVSGSAAPSLPVLDASLRWWDVETGQQLRSAELPVNVIFQVALSPDGRTALVASDNPAITVWDVGTWQESGRLEGHQGPVTAVEFTPDGKRALSLSVDGTLILWDMATRKAIRNFYAHGDGLWSLAISPDGHTALSESGDSSMLLWDLETGQELRNFQRPDPPGDPGSTGMAFSPDGRAAISCEQDGVLIEWDLESGKEIRRLGQHPSLRTRVAISPDGILALTSGMDGLLKLWDLRTGELVHQSSGHGVIFDISLAPDGKSAFFGSSDHTVIQWRISNLSLEELRAWIQANRYVRDLTCAEQASFQIETSQGESCTP